MKNPLDITVLCKVVDNFGDIGVVYRLIKALKEVSDQNPDFPPIKIRLILDNLLSFKLLCPSVDENAQTQTVNDIQIFKWDSPLCLKEFQKNPPEILLECFQCGRPDWLETLLFEIKIPDPCQIIMIDYLTAEDYAESFHKLLSLTRSARVKKVNFMPGFTPKTGGLIISDFEKNTFLCGESLPPAPKQSFSASPSPRGTPLKPQNKIPKFNIFFFSYPKDLTPVLKSFQKFNQNCLKNNLNVLLAQGAGFSSFKDAYSKLEQKNLFSLSELDFVPQEIWDSLLFSSDILFIRGEDSLSRACLYGKPFVWNAYPQSEDYQLVKVQALLQKLKPFFPEKEFLIIQNLWLIYNGKEGNLEKAVYDFLSNYHNLREGFFNFSQSLKKNGNLAFHLMTFILKDCIIKKQ